MNHTVIMRSNSKKANSKQENIAVSIVGSVVFHIILHNFTNRINSSIFAYCCNTRNFNHVVDNNSKCNKIKWTEMKWRNKLNWLKRILTGLWATFNKSSGIASPQTSPHKNNNAISINFSFPMLLFAISKIFCTNLFTISIKKMTKERKGRGREWE